MESATTDAPEIEAPEDAIDYSVFDGLPPIFRDCAAIHPGRRFDMRLPWQHGDYVYATNGVILARVLAATVAPGTLAKLPTEGKRPKDPGKVFTEWGDAQDTPISLPDVGTYRPVCQSCMGAGRVAEKACWRCEGKREAKCEECGTVGVCSTCKGSGVMPAHTCMHCEGSGRPDLSSEPVDIAPGSTFDRHHLVTLKRCGMVAYPITPIKPKTCALYFRSVSDGVDGMLMGFGNP
jgi:hypothetical protein